MAWKQWRIRWRFYGWEPSAALCKEAKESRCIIVYGASDDLCELRGFIENEVGCFDGGDIELEELKALGIELAAIWCDTSAEWTWTYSCNKPVCTFHMLDEDEKYCKGIVICVD